MPAFYRANWGSLRLMFRFPSGLLEEDKVSHYLLEEYITFVTFGVGCIPCLPILR
ncbi:MAG: hypothetical protein ACOYXO_02330 [Chloroflexota bacterium]